MKKRLLSISSEQRRNSFGARAVLCAAFIACGVLVVGCQSTGGAKRSCLFGRGSCNEQEERGQDPAQKEPTVPPIPPETTKDGEPLASATATVASPETSATNNFAFPNEIAINSGAPESNRNAYVENANSPDYVQEPSAPNSANDSVVAAPAASPEPRYLSVAPSKTQPEASQSGTSESKYIEFESPAYDYSATPLPNELRALGTLFGFESPEALPSGPATSSATPLPADFAPVDKKAPVVGPQPASTPAVPAPPVESPSAASERVLMSQREIEDAYLTREPTSFRDYAVARSAKAPRASASRYVDNAAASASVTIPSPNGSGAQNGQTAQSAPASSQRRESKFFPGQYVGGVVDGSGARAVAK